MEPHGRSVGSNLRCAMSSFCPTVTCSPSLLSSRLEIPLSCVGSILVAQSKPSGAGPIRTVKRRISARQIARPGGAGRSGSRAKSKPPLPGDTRSLLSPSAIVALTKLPIVADIVGITSQEFEGIAAEVEIVRNARGIILAPVVCWRHKPSPQHPLGDGDCELRHRPKRCPFCAVGAHRGALRADRFESC